MTDRFQKVRDALYDYLQKNEAVDVYEFAWDNGFSNEDVTTVVEEFEQKGWLK